MKIYTIIVCITFLTTLFFSCGRNEKFSENQEKIILDTDMGSDCDDVGALALLNEYSNTGNAEILGIIYSSGAIPYGVGIIDAINRYYDNHDIPIGANFDKSVGDTIDKMDAEKLAKDTSAFKNKFIVSTDVTEQTQLNRKLLSMQNDNCITYITIGHTKGLYDLLISKPDTISDLTGFELVNKKIKRWIALGAMRANNKEGYYAKDWNFFFNGTVEYTKYLIDHFPKPIFFIDGGTNVMTGRSLMNTPNGNIVRTAYRDWLWNYERKTLCEQRPSWDLVTVYFAVEGPGKYFEILNEGYLDFDPNKGCRWIGTDSMTNQNYVIQKSDTDVDFSNYLNEMISKHQKMNECN